MRPITQIANSALQSKPNKPNSATTTELSENERMKRVTIRLWKKMTEIHGHRWTSSFGQATKPDGNLTSTAQTWCDSLRQFTPDQIKAGLARMVETGDDWPTLVSFIKHCRGPESELNELTKRCRAADAEFKAALPKSTMTREERQAALEKFRAEVGKVLPTAKPDMTEQSKPEPFRVDPGKRAEREKQFRELGVEI